MWGGSLLTQNIFPKQTYGEAATASSFAASCRHGSCPQAQTLRHLLAESFRAVNNLKRCTQLASRPPHVSGRYPAGPSMTIKIRPTRLSSAGLNLSGQRTAIKITLNQEPAC